MDSTSIKKFKNKRRYVLFFVLFFIIGLSIGGFGTYKSLSMKNDDEEEIVEKDKKDKVEENVEEDILKNPDYTELIERLYSYLAKDIVFYNSTGLDINNVSNEDKLRIVYKYIVNNKLYDNVELDPMYFGALTCNYNFNLDVVIGENGVLSNGNKCSVIKISKEKFISMYNSIFANDKIDTVNFVPFSTKSCVLVEDNYYCGNINNSTGITGNLEARFEIVDVKKYSDKIVIYDKGYLVDGRSNIKNPDDGHDNYYLHTTDSSSYYYELKSAENVTFMHTFVVNEDGNYKYSSTSVLEK